ncbi:hypothetical protein DFH08DRAFT_808294 [Mycena albidolilacea]|uniref:Uncharacterized protein n=1 Tax=Mycena albidolilacea TaxID=1033008 RepID=A0AAD7A442_9AGAR|nr:hypothetical protein DFH08DRAFT_808294 [Mycena albidolilacea]
MCHVVELPPPQKIKVPPLQTFAPTATLDATATPRNSETAALCHHRQSNLSSIFCLQVYFTVQILMVKPSDIVKLKGAGNYWTWKSDAMSLLLADGLWNTVDPSVPVPNGAVQMRAWASDNLKAHGILFLMPSQAVKDKINNAGIGIKGCLLWVTLKLYYTTADPATRSILMSQFHTISHNLSQPADKFLQARPETVCRIETVG